MPEETSPTFQEAKPGAVSIMALEPEEKKASMWQAWCSVVAAVAENIKEADIVEMTNMFRMAFRSFLATIIVIIFSSLLYDIALMPETDETKLNRFVGVILGYAAGVLTMAAGFYFGGQDRTKKPEPEPLRDIKP